MAIDSKLIDQLLAECERPEDLLGKDGLIKELTARLAWGRALEAELTDHLGYQKHHPAGRGTGNSRNGHAAKDPLRKKTLKSDGGEIPLRVPRDRAGTFEPRLVPKRQSRMPSFDE